MSILDIGKAYWESLCRLETMKEGPLTQVGGGRQQLDALLHHIMNDTMRINFLENTLNQQNVLLNSMSTRLDELQKSVTEKERSSKQKDEVVDLRLRIDKIKIDYLMIVPEIERSYELRPLIYNDIALTEFKDIWRRVEERHNLRKQLSALIDSIDQHKSESDVTQAEQLIRQIGNCPMTEKQMSNWIDLSIGFNSSKNTVLRLKAAKKMFD